MLEMTFPDEVLDLDKSVRTLDLTHNKLVGQLVRLERLSISGNMLTFLPETIGSLRNLSLLNVSNNKLKALPESIGSCFSLEELQANDNLIEDLPGSICNLVHLKSLSLNNNNVSQIPSNLLKDCKALQNISLHDNPISMDQFQQRSALSLKENYFPELSMVQKRSFNEEPYSIACKHPRKVEYNNRLVSFSDFVPLEVALTTPQVPGECGLTENATEGHERLASDIIARFPVSTETM
ncbi:hypothetical protein GH714_040893 [Hevea brasiliensis]|uniref:Uncharacterized protein n=1 Tax=Hevea brasiliensis TaxID=3981 RepID=A0A6A6MKF6_HEVBR|nr:hypothetical protein GH714_040893 [Hevea brasiliensis]